MVFGDGQFNSVIQIYPGHSLVAMATKLGTKWAIICVYRGVFGVGPSNATNEIFPRPSLVVMATEFGTKWAITWLLLEISARFLHL